MSTASIRSSSSALLQNEDSDELGILYFPQNIKKPLSFWLAIILMSVYGVCFLLSLPFQLYFTSPISISIGLTVIPLTSVVLYFFTFLLTLVMYFDLKKLQRNGYSQFHKEIKSMLFCPTIVFSLGNTALLMYMVILFNLHGRMLTSEGLSADQKYLFGFQILLGLQILISLYGLKSLTVKLYKFTSRRRLPDLLDEEIPPLHDDDAIHAALPTPLAPEDTITELHEKKMDFFRRRCDLLNRALQHVIQDLPPTLKTSTQTSLQDFLDGRSTGNSAENTARHLASDDDYLISA